MLIPTSQLRLMRSYRHLPNDYDFEQNLPDSLFSRQNIEVIRSEYLTTEHIDSKLSTEKPNSATFQKALPKHVTLLRWQANLNSDMLTPRIEYSCSI